MRAVLARTCRRHPVWAGLIATAVTVILALTSREAAGAAQFVAFASRLEPSLAFPTAPDARRSSWPFLFRGHTYAIGALVDPGRLEAERAIDTSWIFSTTGPVREQFVRHLIARESASPLVEELAGQTRALGESLGLDDDGYLELLVRAVQDIPYDATDPRVRLPLQTVADGRAVCSGKSILLAALMVHEGYDSVFWVLDTQGHVAIGVAAAGPTYRDSGYAWIETTRPSYIGQAYPDSLGRGPITRPPQMIALGGVKAYGAWRQTSFILSRLEEERRTAFALERYAQYTGASTPWQPEYVRMAAGYLRAAALRSFIEANSDDRPLVYDRLLRGPDGRRTGI